MSEASKRARLGIDVEVPPWVRTAGLSEEFLETAALAGEEAAASYCRRLKREMARAVGA